VEEVGWPGTYVPLAGLADAGSGGGVCPRSSVLKHRAWGNAKRKSRDIQMRECQMCGCHAPRCVDMGPCAGCPVGEPKNMPTQAWDMAPMTMPPAVQRPALKASRARRYCRANSPLECAGCHRSRYPETFARGQRGSTGLRVRRPVATGWLHRERRHGDSHLQLATYAGCLMIQSDSIAIEAARGYMFHGLWLFQEETTPSVSNCPSAGHHNS